MDTEKHRELNDQQKSFVLHYTSTDGVAGNAAEAARRAGYTKKYAADLGRQLLEKPHVSAAIDAALREAIGTRLTVKAVTVIESILTSKDASLKLKGDMAAKVIEFSGLVERTKAQKAKEAGLGFDKPLTEFTRAELEAVVAKGAEVLKMADELAQQSARPN
jgi:phage terminase small subunit